MEQETGNAEADLPLDLKCSITSVTNDEADFNPCQTETEVVKSEENVQETKVEPTEAIDEHPPESSSPSQRASPEPSCAICLGQLENKSFTDGCFHPFCFNCLVEWSKVKAECPLCKQRFKSIVYNVRSNEDYDLYTVTRSSAESSWRSDDGSRRFRYSSTLTSERIMERHMQSSFEDHSHQPEFQMHRMMFAPHTMNYMSAISRSNPHIIATGFRHSIYERGLWVRPLAPATKVRDTSPRFYFQNPACTHRLIPFLNRELLALLQNSESRAMCVLELIMALIVRYDIRSEEFYRRVEVHLGDRTSHFVHEFYHFASSIYDIDDYDRHISYEQLETYDSTVVLSSPESDVIYVPNDNQSPTPGPSSAPSTSCFTSRNHTPHMNVNGVKKLFLRRNQENDSWNVFPQESPVLSSSGATFATSSAFYSVPDIPLITSCSSALGSSSFISATSIEVEDIISDDDFNNDPDECVIVNELKPRALRTPEIIDIADGSDDECRTVETPRVASPSYSNDGAAQLKRGLHLFLEAMERAIETAAEQNCNVVQSSSGSHQQPSEVPSRSFSVIKGKKLSEIPITENLRTNNHSEDDRKRRRKHAKHCSKGKQKKSHHSSSPTVTNVDNFQMNRSSAIVAVPSTDNSYAHSSSSSSRSRSRDGQKLPLLNQDSSSIESSQTIKHSHYSDSTDVSDSPLEIDEPKRKRKCQMKLRSVVGQVTGDLQSSQNDSGYQSSHTKKHKEKHKKKKKHDKHKCHKHSRSKDSEKE